MEELLKNTELLTALITLIVLVLDLALGRIPDKYVPYVGIIRRIFTKLFKDKNESR